MAAVFLCARARVEAQSQFSTPYDPDFAAPASEGRPEPRRRRPTPERPAEGETTQISPETGEPLPPVLIAPGRKFLLIERRDPKRLLERLDEPAPEAPAAPEDFTEFQLRLRGLQYSQERYNETRRKLEQGIELEELERGPEGPIAPTSIAVSTETAPMPPPPEVELPTYGTSLSITGRKVIGFNFSEKRFLNAQTKTGRVATTNLIEINQQLQLRMQGKVGPKITVNVDYDDTKTNHQDISVVYTGDPNEVVQNVAFGDIDLSLPATEFVSYNKQLFGIRADVKYKGLKATFIGSRTKGTTKSRQFNGNTQFVQTDIQDTSYVRRTYYDIAFGNAARLPIRQGSEQVFLARQIPGQTNVTDVTLTANDLAVQSSSFTGIFTPLNAGIDYTIDYVKGILTFRSGLLPQYVVAVDYIDANGVQLSVQTSTTGPTSTNSCAPSIAGTACFHAPKLVKTPNDLPLNVESTTSTAQVGWNREMKTFYNIGQTQIVRDNGRGNFILQVMNQQRVEVGSSLNPQQKYPETIEVDFENGVFRLQQPFAVEGDSATVDPDIYAPTPISKRIIHLEYSFRFKTFFLEPNLVLQSEIVILDGVRLNRNVDYFIDYEAGFITFFNEDRIHAQSTIDIAYEVAPFAGITDESLLGTRVSYDITDKIAVGSTLLYQSGAKSQTTPSITELARSLMVYDFDAKLHDLRLGRRLKLTSFAGEFAQSRQNLNLNDYALIDNMEGIKQEDTASTLSQLWFIGSQVPGSTPASLGPVHPGHLSWLSEDVRVLDINPRAQASNNETQKVLTLNYNTLADNEQVSIVFPFSVAGVDMSRKTVLEVVMLGDNSSNQINFRLGGIAEDADGDGVMDTEDVNLDTILQPAEDVGWLYDPTTGPGAGQTARFVAANGRIDSEDLNQNGRLDPDDANGNNVGFGPNLIVPGDTSNETLFSLNNPVPYANARIDFGSGAAGDAAGWQTLQIPLNISSATLSRWTNIRSIQITVRKRAGTAATNGTLKFARIAVVGNTWLAGEARDSSTGAGPVAGETLVVTPVNSVDNPTYTPIFNAGGDASQVFSDLYGSLSQLQRQSNSRNLSEQALQLDFSGMNDDGVAPFPTVETRRQFSRAVDISQHRYFNFLLFSNASTPADTTDHTFFLRVGNETNFFEVRVPLAYTGWRKIRIEQTDTNGDSVMDSWRVADGNPGGTVVVSSGAPSLQQVASLIAGVQQTANATPGVTTGRVFVNEIHLAEPVTRVGTAQKLSADFEYTGWATFGAKYRSIDRNFQTPTSVVANQDNRQDSAYLNLTRLSYFPMTFNLQRVITDTPSTVQTGQLTNTINLLLQGRVTTWTGSAQGNFALGSYPRISLAHTRNRIEYDLLTRLDDRKSYNLTLQYGVPWQTRFLPRTVDVNAGLMNYDVSFKDLQARLLPGNFNTNERTHNGGIRLTFTPWEGSTFNPAYSLTRVDERRREIIDSVTAREVELSYTKSRTQNVGLSSNFRIFSWLNPQLNYSLDTLENNILSTTTFVISASTFVFRPGEIKTINRTANGSISLPLSIGEILPRSKLFRSFTFVNGYQLQDGDVYNNVESSLNSLTKLWIRSGLRPANPAAVKTSQTLRDTYNSTQRWSPLEAYSIGGRLAALKTFSISNNFVRSIQRSEVTGTPSKTITTTLPDLVASIGQLEQLLHTERFMSNTQMNYKYQARRTENVGQTITDESSFGTDLRSIVRRRFDTVVSFNKRDSTNRNLLVAANTQETKHEDATVQVTFDVGKFRMTPKTDYSRDVTRLGTGVKTQDLMLITPSVLIRGDLALPRGLVLPGTTRTLLFTNRVIWTTTISLQNRKSPVTVADNSRLASMTTSADYEIAKNLRMTLNGAFARLWHRFLPEENFISYQFGTTLTFQF